MSLTTQQQNQVAAIVKGHADPKTLRALCKHADVTSLLQLGAITRDQSYRAQRLIHRSE